MTDSYREALEDSKVRLRNLVSQRDQVGADIEKVKTAIEALANMLNDPDETCTEILEMHNILGPEGLTEAVRRILQASTKKGMTPIDVRDALSKSGFDLAAYSNPLAAIHTILKRLVKAGNAKPTIIDGDQTVYEWIGIRRFPRLRPNGFIAQGMFNSKKRSR